MADTNQEPRSVGVGPSARSVGAEERCAGARILRHKAGRGVGSLSLFLYLMTVLKLVDEFHAANAASAELDLAVLALESVRLLKLYYWTIVEHVRSDDGEQVWRGASVMLQQFSTETEWLELIEEFGGVQQGDSRSHVEIPEVAESGRSCVR